MRLPDFEARRCAVVGISVDDIVANAKLRSDAGLSFPILSDADLRAIDAYGLRHRDGHDGNDIALATSILIDGSGTVQWVDVAENFRQRPLVDDILRQIDKLPAS